ncbi:ATP-binding protein [Halarchaeum sp. P4]|uniref:sensor histidine kinase n=1 Tax=Halarchaeum sp. P4 TaxID=3421639 RepID=UPI003EB94100
MSDASGGERRERPAHEAGEPTPSPWPRRYRLAWGTAALALVVVFGSVWLLLGDAADVQLASDAAVTLGNVVAALAVTYRARTVASAMRRGWQALAAGLWFVLAGDVVWVVLVALTGRVPYPGLPDVAYLAAYPLLAGGFALLAVDPRDQRPWLRFTLDGLVVSAALLTLGWHFALHPILGTGSLRGLETWLGLAYPVLDILVASIGLVVAMNARGPRRPALALLAAGVFAWTIGDVAFAAVATGSTTEYATLGLFWLVGHLAIALGAAHPDADAPPVPGQSRHYEFGELVYPYLPFSLAIGLVAVLGFTDALDKGDVVFATLGVVALVVRQVFVARDVDRLGRALDANARTLAARNEELLLVNRIVRHDIRNDTTVAHGWASELRGHVDDAGEPMLERVLRTLRHTTDVTETLRDFLDALEPGGGPALEATSLRPHLEEPVEVCRTLFPHATYAVGDVPDVEVAANSLLNSVFRNLLTNAVRHTDVEHPEIAVTVQTTDDAVRVRIADNGPGVSDELTGELFGRGARSAESPGSGIGLYLVQTLLTQYGGDVWVEENEPRGAVFVVELRRADAT